MNNNVFRIDFLFALESYITKMIIKTQEIQKKEGRSVNILFQLCVCMCVMRLNLFFCVTIMYAMVVKFYDGILFSSSCSCSTPFHLQIYTFLFFLLYLYFFFQFGVVYPIATDEISKLFFFIHNFYFISNFPCYMRC